MKKNVFLMGLMWCAVMTVHGQWYLSSTDTMPDYPYLHYGECLPTWGGGYMHDGITCYMSQCMCLPTLTLDAPIPMKETAVRRHASDTIHVVGLAMGETRGYPPSFTFRLSLYDSDMTLLKRLDTYDYSWWATDKDTQVHPIYLPGHVIVRSDVVLFTFAYFDDGPVDVIGDYYLGWAMYSVSQQGDTNIHSQPLNLLYEEHDAPYQMDSMVWRYRVWTNPSIWRDSITRGMNMIFPIITPPCDTIAWASAAMEGDSVVRVQWDSTVDEVQVCLMPMGETPDSTGIFVKDTAAFDTIVARGDYDVYVRRVCNERYLVCSDWTGPLTVRSSPINPDPEDPPEGIREVAGTVGFTLRPNPAREEVTLEGGAWMAGGVLTVTDMRGTEVVRRKVESGRLTLDVSRLPKGAYTVSVTTSEGTAARRLVVQ